MWGQGLDRVWIRVRVRAITLLAAAVAWQHILPALYAFPVVAFNTMITLRKVDMVFLL